MVSPPRPVLKQSRCELVAQAHNHSKTSVYEGPNNLGGSGNLLEILIANGAFVEQFKK